MENVLKRGSTYHYDATIGARRVRCSLGVTCPKSAKRLANRISFAVADGPQSEVWPTLRLTLPPASYKTIATGIGQSAPPDLVGFEELFREKLDRRTALREISPSTQTLYETSASGFFSWLIGQKIGQISQVTPSLIEKYQVWRKNLVTSRPQSKNGRSLLTDNTVLAAIFELAQEERLIEKSPFKGRFRSFGPPKGAEPFTPEEIAKLEAEAKGEEKLAFTLLRWTGLRGSDAAAVTWGAVDFEAAKLKWTTLKRGTEVIVPLAAPLLEALVGAFSWEDEAEGRYTDDERILPNMTRPKLYRMIKDLGNRAGVKNSTPHRFRDYLAVDMLTKGATIYDVAKMLGDSVTVVEKHYAPFTPGLQERVRGILNSR